MAESPVKVTVSSIPSNIGTIATVNSIPSNIGTLATVNSIPSNVGTIVTVSNSAWHCVDPIAEKFKELEERIDAWQNKFEFVDVRNK